MQQRPRSADHCGARQSDPVSCTNPLHAEASVSASGVLAATNFTVAEGRVGPPTTGTDSSSGSATTDAGAYSCPPTPTQVTNGDACTISFGDTDGDQVSQVLGFASGTGNTGDTGNTGTTTTSSTTTTTTTTTPSSTTRPPRLLERASRLADYSLACTAAQVPVNLPSVVTEGVFETNPGSRRGGRQPGGQQQGRTEFPLEQRELVERSRYGTRARDRVPDLSRSIDDARSHRHLLGHVAPHRDGWRSGRRRSISAAALPCPLATRATPPCCRRGRKAAEASRLASSPR